MKTTLEQLNGFEAYLKEKIIGQDYAIEKTIDSFENGALGLSDPDKPLASLLLLGPIGVGKTSLALYAGEFVVGEQKVFRFDLSEYQHVDGLKRLLGSNTNDTGRLGEILKSHDSGMLLFDNIELANCSIVNIVSQIIGSSRITLSDHQTYNLSKFFVVCTSNIGADIFVDIRSKNPPQIRIENAIFSQLSEHFNFYFIGRFDKKIVFMPLSTDSLRTIAKINIKKVISLYFEEHGYQLEVDNSAVEFLVRIGCNPLFGARPMKQAVFKHIADAVRNALREYSSANGIISSSLDHSKLIINR